MTTVVSDELIAERRRLGLDGRDEVWDGVYHVVPPASGEHQRIEARLLRTLGPLADAAGLELQPETGLFDRERPLERDYRVPDLIAFQEELRIPAGVSGPAELVIEIRSPGDDSLLKIPYYSRLGVGELVVVERDTKQVRRWVAGEAGLVEVEPGDGGWHALRALPVRLRGVAGGLEVSWAAGSTTI